MSKAIVFRTRNNEKVYPCPYYPIGSIYISVNSTNPSTYFGGSWTQIKDRFLLACGSTYSNGSTGGEATHKLTTAEMPSHTHGSKSLVGKMQFRALTNGTNIADIYSSGNTICSYTQDGGSTWGIGINYTSGSNKATDVLTVDATHEHTSVGGNGAHNNMPPYLAVYVWKRVS